MAFPPLDTWQFRITESGSADAIAVGRMYLDAGPATETVTVSEAGGRRMGVLIGVPIDLETERVLHGDHRTDFGFDGDPDRFARDLLDSLAGPFLLVLDAGESCRIYPDAGTQVPCVFDPAARVAASTAHAMFDDATYERRFNRALFKALDIAAEGWFPGGLTAHHGVERLLPNFYLDMADWRVHRFWPRETFTPDPQAERALDEMAVLVRKQVAALAKEPNTVVQALTAGHETRTLLACARPVAQQIDLVTVTGGDRHSTDTVMARRICGDLGLRHRELPRVVASAEERELFLRRGGHCVGGSNSIYHPSMRPLNRDHVFLGGIGGEVGRAFLWHSGDTASTEVTPSQIVLRLGLPAVPEVVAKVADWRKTLPPLSTFQMLDLAFLELRVGPWASAQFCSDPDLVRFAPLITYRGIDRLLRLPDELKRTKWPFHDLIRRQWPALVAYPYNSLGRFRDLYAQVVRVVREPKVVMMKLRKMRG